MINEDWYLKAEEFVAEVRKLGNGTVNLKAARLARELFQYDTTADSTIAIYNGAALLDDPDVHEYAARTWLEDEEEARIAAMEHRL